MSLTLPFVTLASAVAPFPKFVLSIILTLGASLYPDPGLVTTTVRTFPVFGSMTGTAEAPEPSP